MTAYYNENDPFAAQWLRNLMSAGHIPAGDVDERSIEDVVPSDLFGYTNCHFFAGIGGWALALALAEWPLDRPVWTGSCPCQPFSSAGKGAGFADERHLWPAWHHLIRECRPAIVFGEQVASPAALAWWDLVRADLEASHYACGAADLCAASVNAPHIRQRLYWVADARGERRQQIAGGAPGHESEDGRRTHANHVAASYGEGERLAYAEQRGREGGRHGPATSAAVVPTTDCEPHHFDRMADTDGGHASAEREQSSGQFGLHPKGSRAHGGMANAYDATSERLRQHGGQALRIKETSLYREPWAEIEWLECYDGKLRPTRPGIRPLATGIPARVGKLRGAGNSIVPQCAAEFVRAAA